MNPVAAGREAMLAEAAAIELAAGRLDQHFERAVDVLAVAQRVIVSGVGKSGVIAQKIAATLTSTGTPSIWLHPVDSLHGDLGLVTPGTAAIILSKSGETEELFGMLSVLARLGVPVVAITGGPHSSLARAATAVLDASVSAEACPHDLAPTTSTTVALALGDALAVALLRRKGFRSEDFAALHPGGRLGRRLLLKVDDVMVMPGRMSGPDAPMREVVVALAHGRGIAPIVSEGRLVGVITAGDLTRLVEQHADFGAVPAAEVMSRKPRVARSGELAATVVGRMERESVIAVPVLDDSGAVMGVAHLHDLLRSGAG